MRESTQPNPELVQAEDWSNAKAFSGTTTPVFLIHDGGGTTYAYNCLGSLRRFVYGIRNPHFYNGDVFEGGVAEMGRLYAGWIRKTVAQRGFPALRNPDGSVDVLLGGWSFGGLLSLEVARELEDDYGVRVMGIVMVDSIYPFMPSDFNGEIAPPNEPALERTRNQVLSQRAMDEAGSMIKSWDVPVWENWEAGRRPRIIMLRAKGYIPMDAEGISRLDVCREHKHLGWDAYDKSMFEQVIDVNGHHFDLFESGRIGETTAAIKEALDILD